MWCNFVCQTKVRIHWTSLPVHSVCVFHLGASDLSEIIKLNKSSTAILANFKVVLKSGVHCRSASQSQAYAHSSSLGFGAYAHYLIQIYVGIQNSMAAILTDHPALSRSVRRLDWVVTSCQLWRIRTGSSFWELKSYLVDFRIRLWFFPSRRQLFEIFKYWAFSEGLLDS